MSDKQDSKKEQTENMDNTPAAASSAGLATGGEAAVLEMESAASATSGKKSSPAPRKPSSAIAWLALLLVLGLAGAAGWSLLEAQRREAKLLLRLADVEHVASQKEANLQALGERWQQQLEQGIGELEQGIGELEQGIGELRAETSSQVQAVETVEAQLVEQRAELARYSSNERENWLLAEAEYLLRLANQRLLMAGDAVAAQALLRSADNILRELDDAGLHAVRGAVAADLAAVRAVPNVDVEGIYLRLAALVEQADKLVIFQLPEPDARVREGAAQGWEGRLQQGYEDALLKLSDYIAIRRRDVPMQALMDPQWEGLVRQNLRMLLEQAQVALLSGNQTLYRESLERAQHWVAEFFESDEAAARAMAREITQLMDASIAANMPDISRSLRALDDAIEQRLQQGGDE